MLAVDTDFDGCQAFVKRLLLCSRAQKNQITLAAVPLVLLIGTLEELAAPENETKLQLSSANSMSASSGSFSLQTR